MADKTNDHAPAEHGNGDGPAAEIDQTIVLVGLMGAGKELHQRRLAAHSWPALVDADREIEAAAGCSVADIFAAHGEKAFRDGEPSDSRLLNKQSDPCARHRRRLHGSDLRTHQAAGSLDLAARRSRSVLRRVAPQRPALLQTSSISGRSSPN